MNIDTLTDDVIIYISSYLDNKECVISCSSSSLRNFALAILFNKKNCHIAKVIKNNILNYNFYKFKNYKIFNLRNENICTHCTKLKLKDIKKFDDSINKIIITGESTFIHFDSQSDQLKFRKNIRNIIRNKLNFGNVCCNGKGIRISLNM